MPRFIPDSRPLSPLRSGHANIPLLTTALFLASLVVTLVLSSHFLASGKSAPTRASSYLTSDLRGTVLTATTKHLHLTSAVGNIVIHTNNTGKVDYQVHLEEDPAETNARQILKDFTISAQTISDTVRMNAPAGRNPDSHLRVTIELNIPKTLSVDASSGGGNIDLDDIVSQVYLFTAGGNLTTGNIEGSARLQTTGGHITARNVSGDLTADTGGGHISTGTIGGKASLRTRGGHIHVASIDGAGHLVTGGGNVTLEHSGPELIAETAGGQIEVGEATGLVHAKTGGGGIRVVRVSGPSDLQTVGGSIYLTQVDSAVKASTGAGGITAWFVMPAKQSGDCDLQSSDGDIVVYLPRRLPVTIDAQIQRADDHRVIVDPAFPLQVTYHDSHKGLRTIRAEGSLNGGGELLKLRATQGNIRLVLSEDNRQIHLYNQEMERIQQELRQLRLQLRNLISSQEGYDALTH